MVVNQNDCLPSHLLTIRQKLASCVHCPRAMRAYAVANCQAGTLMQFVHAFDAIFELATVLRELLGYFVDAAWYVATERSRQKIKLRRYCAAGSVSVVPPKIRSSRIRAVRENQTIIQFDVCDHLPFWNIYRRPAQVAPPA